MSKVIGYFRDGFNVKRFHTARIVQEETVGHHSANVAMLCYHLTLGEPSAALLLAALTHDMGEQYTGDVPATAKWKSPSLKRALDELEELCGAVSMTERLTPLERRILKQADMLDLCLKCYEELDLGNANAAPILERGIEWLRDHDPLPITLDVLNSMSEDYDA